MLPLKRFQYLSDLQWPYCQTYNPLGHQTQTWQLLDEGVFQCEQFNGGGGGGMGGRGVSELQTQPGGHETGFTLI